MTHQTAWQRETLLEKAAAKAAAARGRLEDQVREARAEGLPLRTIAKAAGMSHEQVRRLTRTTHQS